jgi:hypothetical protein
VQPLPAALRVVVVALGQAAFGGVLGEHYPVPEASAASTIFGVGRQWTEYSGR